MTFTPFRLPIRIQPREHLGIYAFETLILCWFGIGSKLLAPLSREPALIERPPPPHPRGALLEVPKLVEHGIEAVQQNRDTPAALAVKPLAEVSPVDPHYPRYAIPNLGDIARPAPIPISAPGRYHYEAAVETVEQVDSLLTHLYDDDNTTTIDLEHAARKSLRAMPQFLGWLLKANPAPPVEA